MSEESPVPVSFNSGDVVWVKLGSSWWPGEVKDLEELPTDILDFKKPPLVIVKFFDEDSYEYVRSWTNIYHYNCEKKNDFIRKGMVAFRAKVPHLEKFPKDVLMAEEKVGGNPNILSEPIFLPETKRNYVAEVFGTPSPKPKLNKDKRGRPSSAKKHKDTAHITHRRFLGVDDYQAYICIQYPGKDRIPGDREDEEVLRINRECEEEFNCQSCSFTTKRLEVMILHTKSHIEGGYAAKKRNAAMMRRKRDNARRSRPTDTIESESDSSDSEPVREKKRKPRTQNPRKPRIKKVVKKVEPPKKTDICSELLAVWDDSEEEEEEFSSTLNKTVTTESEFNQSAVPEDKTDKPKEAGDNVLSQSVDEQVNKSNESKDVEKTLDKTVEEAVAELNKTDSSQPIDDSLNESTKEQTAKPIGEDTSQLKAQTEEVLNQSSVEERRKSTNEPVTEKVSKPKDELKPNKAEDVNEKSEETESKTNRDIQEEIKSCFDFDEDEEDDHAIVSKAAAGRKIPRVIPIAERKKSSDIIDEINRDEILKESANFNRKEGEGADAAFKDLMDLTAVPELPEVQNTLKCEQNFHNIKTIKFPDKLEPTESPPKAVSEKKDSTEVATKLTNPKKRFVKSFEDFELMQNEIRRKEEEQQELPKNDKYDDRVSSEETDTTYSDIMQYDDMDSNCSLSKLKSKIMSKIIEEAQINEESKTKIMSKINSKEDIDTEPVSTSRSLDSSEETKVVSTLSHRTPRSKILASYRSKHKTEEEPTVDKVNVADPKNNVESTESKQITQGRLHDTLSKKDVVPPKKSKWSRRGSHPKKDRKFFVTQDPAAEETVSKEVASEEKAQKQADQKTDELDVTDTLKSVPSNSDVGDDELVAPSEASKELDVVETNVEADLKEAEAQPLENKQNETIVPDKVEAEQVESNKDDQTEAPVLEVEESSKDELIPEATVPAEILVEKEETCELPKAEQLDTEATMSLQLKVDEIENFLTRDEATDSVLSNDDKPAEEEIKEQYFALNVENDKLETELTKECTDDLPSESVATVSEAPIESLPDVDVEKDTPSSNDLLEVAEQKPLEETSTEDDQKLPPAKDEAEPVEEAASEQAPLLSPTADALIVADTDVPKIVPESSPKKSKKRKMSESSPKNGTSNDQAEVENFVPLEKRKKDATDDTEPAETPTAMETQDVEPDKTATKEGSVVETQQIEVTSETQLADPDLKSNVPDKSNDVVDETTDHNNEVEIQCASSAVEGFKFSIQTNLSNLTSREEMSALALATLCHITDDMKTTETKVAEENNLVLPAAPEPELVPIEGNLTVVSEKDLADGQVEITSSQVISPKKPVTLSNFSMDFSDSASDSNSISESLSDVSSFRRKPDFISKGTEFTSKAMTKQLKKVGNKKENAYERLELLNILEGNSDSERKTKEYGQRQAKKSTNTTLDEIFDFEEHIPSQIVCTKKLKHDSKIDFDDVKEKTQKSTASKLLERLTEAKGKASTPKTTVDRDVKVPDNLGKILPKLPALTPTATKNTKYVVKSKSASVTKPIILSEQIIKPASDTSKSKKLLNDIEDVEAFVIHKDPKKFNFDDDDGSKSKTSAKTAGKAKILQQTIITPAGEIIQPTVAQVQSDDIIFDINSMPIVLSDEILTPESIEKLPIVLSEETKTTDTGKATRRTLPHTRLLGKTTVVATQSSPSKPPVTKHSKPPRILQTVGNKMVKTSPLLPSTTKPGKYIIVPQSGMTPTKLISKKPAIVKRAVPAGIVSKVPNIAPEPSGNKIMIVTNPQGQQQRLLLTPAQQKMLGYQNQRVTKTVMKGNVIQKSVLATKTGSLAEASTSGVAKSPSLIGQKLVIGTNSNISLMTTTSHQIISTQGRAKTVTKRISSTSQKVFSNTNKPQKTILIKNQHGQTVRKIQGTDDALLDKQVAEQLEAIKASSGVKFTTQPKQPEAFKPTPLPPKITMRRSYSKKIEHKPKSGPPPLTGIQQSPKPKPETVVAMSSFSQAKKTGTVDTVPPLITEEKTLDRPLNQLVIQDAVGNQTTITEGQILALPSETVDGQPQSYMLVTLDESGNLTPLNSEALMSLDPNLGLGGDLSNMVLQIDQGALTERPQAAEVKTTEPDKMDTTPVPDAAITTEVTDDVVEQKIVPMSETPQPIIPSTNGDPGQQLIVTGDPIATQKFLESLTEGTTDLANILANADGNSILIHADGQQILINTNADNQMLLSVNNDNVNVSESTEGGGNPIFATQPNKNQDILAAALADTDVFQQEQHATQGKMTSQLSPNNTLYPMNVGNVLETSLTLNTPIMTPLEVPSTNTKKIPDEEADILIQVPKNVDLPITITDPNIVQTVANQQVASMIANELQTNLELGLPISETTISSVSTEMNSPSYVYSLPTLDDSDITQKPFNSSMPLLNEDVEESTSETKEEEDKISSEQCDSSAKDQAEISSEGCFLDEEEGRFTLGGEMCSSLSEPPPEMFDLPEANRNYIEKSSADIPSSLQSTPDVSDNASKDDDTTDLSIQAESSSDGSCEIPLQPQIVTKSLDLSKKLDSFKRSMEGSEQDSKKCKFD